jgi:hypothetical protein
MFLSQFKESNDKEIQMKDTNIDAFKVFLKCIYFEEFHSKSFYDYSLAIDIFKLSHRFQIKHLSLNIEEVLIELISIENIVDIYDFALVFELNKLLNALKKFSNENEK